jgi:hypothetical protein
MTTTTKTPRIRFETLSNGLIRAFDYSTRTSGLYNADGSYRSGDLHLTLAFVLKNISK